MKLNIHIPVILLFVSCLVKGQVIINGNSSSTVEPHSTAMLLVKNQADNSNVKALGLPVVANATQLPKYNASQPDSYDDDPTMEGMLMFNADPAVNTVVVYDGQKWQKAFSVMQSNLTRARVGSAISIPGAGGDINFTIYDDVTNGYFDYLKIKTGVTQANVFEIRQSGVYRINLGVDVSLASGIKLLATAFVNDNYRFALKNTVAQAGTSRIANYEFSMFLKQGEKVRFQISSENSSAFTINANNLSSIIFEKIM